MIAQNDKLELDVSVEGDVSAYHRRSAVRMRSYRNSPGDICIDLPDSTTLEVFR
jgi:hypothetical protein